MMREGDRLWAQESVNSGQSKESARPVPPQCIANNAYKCWQPLPGDKTAANAPAAMLAQGGHVSWFARLRFSFFQR
jgi:hypothetical protein